MFYLTKDDENQRYIFTCYNTVEELFSKDDIDFFKKHCIIINRNLDNQSTSIKISYIIESEILGKAIKRILRNTKSP
jgi:hypothetical protein